MSNVSQLPASAKILANPQGKGGYTGVEDPGNRQETIIWKCAWEDRNAFRNVVVGFPETFVIGGVTVTRNVTLQSPYTPSLYASSLSFESQGKAGTTKSNPYNWAIFKVGFSIPTIGNGGEDSPYYSISEQASTRSITIPNRKNKFANGEELDSNVALIFPGVSFLLQIFQVNDIVGFRNAILPMLKTPVNSSAITIDGLNVPAGEALLESYSTESSVSGLGVRQHSASMVINVSSLPWNSYVRSDGQIDELEEPPYKTGNLNSLIQ
ncbi:hypothetical protein TA3x_004281 [Tundrisphaera sp. TA3]|uniref:hypothetical protein n=1 Tax=Tundrisphaera sp. TA3 TaxID=3435775 RepID=UPI003EB7D7FF